MKERIFTNILFILMSIVAPCVITILINGHEVEIDDEINKLDTGRDVLIQLENSNLLLDVEQYIAGVLPGIIDYNSDDKYIEAQAVAIRTKVYYIMAEANIVNAADLEYRYYSEEECSKKWGKDNYKRIKKKYNQAVLNTVGEVIK